MGYQKVGRRKRPRRQVPKIQPDVLEKVDGWDISRAYSSTGRTQTQNHELQGGVRN